MRHASSMDVRAHTRRLSARLADNNAWADVDFVYHVAERVGHFDTLADPLYYPNVRPR